MPSGYTCGVQEGTITNFRDYALQCARAFGACIMLRDEPMSNDIPEFVPSDYHAKRQAEQQAELAAIEAMSIVEVQAACEREYQSEVDYRVKRLAEIATQRQRYESMLGAARAFQPPTPEHVELKEFMIKQLKESIKWDCDSSYYDDPPVKKDAAEWMKERRGQLKAEIARCEKEYREEVERTHGRNKWVQDLKRALK